MFFDKIIKIFQKTKKQYENHSKDLEARNIMYLPNNLIRLH